MPSLLELIWRETGPLLQLCFPFHQNSSSAQRFETSVHSFVNMHGLFMLNVTFLVYECFRVSSSLCFFQCHWLFAKVWQSLCEKVRTNFPVPPFKSSRFISGVALLWTLSSGLFQRFQCSVFVSHYGNGTIITRPVESLHTYQKQYSNSRT